MQYADFFKIIIYPILLITISTLSISGIITVYMDESFLRFSYHFMYYYDNIYYFMLLGICVFA